MLDLLKDHLYITGINMKVNRIYYERKTTVRAAIYARVSTAGRAQLKSLSAQVSALTRYVYGYKDSGWVLCDVYMEVVSGKNTSEREEFKRLLQDCKAHKIDYVIVKSIERFGRDTVDVVSAVREIRNAGAQVFFQREDIDTAKLDSEISISLAAAIAQAENESRSASIREGLAYRAESGKSGLFRRKCYGYDKDTDGNLIINEEQGKIVKHIFNLCCEGNSINKIRKTLFEEQVPTPSGELKIWSKKSVSDILTNSKYTGNVVIKPCTEPGCCTVLENGCPVIISKEQFELAQAELAMRTKRQPKDS